MLGYLKNIYDFFFKNRSAKQVESSEKFNLEAIVEILSEYVGVIIVGFNAFNEDIPNLENKLISKYISSIDYQNDHILLKLSNIDNSFGGYLKLTPDITGSFSEHEDIIEENEDVSNIIYQIVFFGGYIFEYADENGKGSIQYFKDLPKRKKK